MRAKEFITEEQSLHHDIAFALPATYVLPELLNQDPYKQYRFGLKLAAAGPDQPSHTISSDESAWGENMAVLTYTDEEKQILDMALKQGHKSSRLITTPKSEESDTVNNKSPVAQKKKNRFGV